MSKIIQLRRGKKSTFSSTGLKKDTVLAPGEIFIEYPDTGIGTGPCNIKIGDGVSTYEYLPYTVNNDEVDDGGKTATNYIHEDTTNNILTISNEGEINSSHTVEDLENSNIRMDEDSVDIYSGQSKIVEVSDSVTVNAKYTNYTSEGQEITSDPIFKINNSDNPTEHYKFTELTPSHDYTELGTFTDTFNINNFFDNSIISNNIISNGIFAEEKYTTPGDILDYEFTPAMSTTGNAQLTITYTNTLYKKIQRIDISVTYWTSPSNWGASASNEIIFTPPDNSIGTHTVSIDDFGLDTSGTDYFSLIHAYEIEDNIIYGYKYTYNYNDFSSSGSSNISYTINSIQNNVCNLSITYENTYGRLFKSFTIKHKTIDYDHSFDIGSRDQTETTVGRGSTVIGEGLIAKNNNQLTVGQYNSNNEYSSNQPTLFEIGDGYNEDSRHTLLTVRSSKAGDNGNFGQVIINGGSLFIKGDNDGEAGNIGNLNAVGYIHANGLFLYDEVEHDNVRYQDKSLSSEYFAFVPGGIYCLYSYEFNANTGAFRGSHAYLYTSPHYYNFDDGDTIREVRAYGSDTPLRVNLASSSSTGITVTQSTWTNSDYEAGAVGWRGFPNFSGIIIKPSSTVYAIRYRIKRITSKSWKDWDYEYAESLSPEV